MSDIMMDDEECGSVQFNCSCFSQGHNMRVTLEKTNEHVVACTFSFYMAGKASLWFRVKEAWKLLRGNDGEVLDFGLRLEDSEGLVGLLCGLVTNPDTR